MRKYLLHILIISFVFLLAPTAHVALYAGEIEDAREEVRNNPDDAKAHFGLGIAYGKSGMYEEAIESFKQAIRIDPDFADAYYGLGIAYELLNDRDSALEQYEILKSLDTERAKELFDYIYE
jgi:tetratricopeptide (TPR) repeat protein